MKSIVGTGVAVFVVVDDNWTLIVDSPRIRSLYGGGISCFSVKGLYSGVVPSIMMIGRL